MQLAPVPNLFLIPIYLTHPRSSLILTLPWVRVAVGYANKDEVREGIVFMINPSAAFLTALTTL